MLAVVAALGAASPASANQTFSGPFTFDPILNTDTGTTLIDLNATVYADANGDSFYNGLGMVEITVDSSYLSGAIHNAAAGQITGGVGVLVQNGSQIDGGFWNEGLIGSAGNAVTIDGNSSVDEGFLNDGTISGGPNGVFLGLNSDINDGVTNNGLITGAIGFNMGGDSSELRGGIANTAGATIVGTGSAAINASGVGLRLHGGITNDGLIQGQNTANGIQLTNGTIAGGITNNATGTIQATGTSATAIVVNGATFNGDITNSGRILATNASAFGVVITGATVFTGNITNNASGTIAADQTAIQINNTTFTGNVTNNGRITAASVDGINLNGTTFAGNIVNSATGVIVAGSDGIEVGAATFTGNVTNDGTITADVSGIYITSAAFTGNVTNNGVITSVSSTGVSVYGNIAGTINNAATGIITGSKGVYVDGSITGGIANAGTIAGRTFGVDLGGANAGVTVTQTAGLIQGNNAGTITTALNMTNAQADIFNGDGGTLDGDVTADAAGNDDFVMHASGTFSYLRGTATGIDQFDMQGSGAAVLGAQLRGATGVGVTVNAASMTHSGTGRVYLDDNTVVNLTGAYTQSAGTLEFQLTSNTAQHGQINAAGGANLGGNIAAYVQGDTFASIGGDTFTYQDVIVGATAGTFANAGTIETNSIFFTGTALVNAGDVDIVLNRQAFNSALALTTLSQNQLSIGGALETIYGAGGYSPQFEDLFNYILSIPAGSEAEVARVYDDLSGSEHASLQDVGLRVTQGFADTIGGRMADMRGPAGGVATAEMGLRRYADATPANVARDVDPPGGSGSGMRGSMSVWARGYGSWTNSDGDAEAAGYDQDSAGFAGGIDFAVAPRWNVGGALGWSSSDVTFATPRDNADVDTFQFAGYGSYASEEFYADATISFGFHDIDSTRFIDVTANPPEVATATYDGNSFGMRTEVGMIYDTGRIDFTPFLGLAYASTSTDGFAETGAGAFDLLVADADADSLTTTLGARFSGAWQAGGVRLIPTAEVAWRHEFLDDNQNFTAAFLEDPATQFTIVSAEQTRDSIIAKAGLGAQVSKNLVLFLDYNGLFSSSLTAHAASAGLRATW